MTPERFEIAVPDATLADLQDRLETTRLPHDSASDWDAGISPAYLEKVIDYWRTTYQWRVHEARINELAQFRTKVGGATLHFIHERGVGDEPLPIVLTHGFPD